MLLRIREFRKSFSNICVVTSRIYIRYSLSYKSGCTFCECFFPLRRFVWRNAKKTRHKACQEAIELYQDLHENSTKQSRRVEIVEIVAAFARRSRLNSISEIAILSCATDGSPIFNDAKIVAPSTVHNRSRIAYARHLDVYLRSPRSPSRSGQVSGRVCECH